MTQAARYFDTVLYTEAEYAEVQNRLLPEGILRQVGSDLLVSAPGGMVVRVAAGEVMIEGFWYKNDANVDLAVAANSTGSTRNDVVALRLNRVTNTVSLVYIPNAPAPVRTPGGDWEMQIATVAVPNGAGAITGGMITDVRYGTFCGFTGQGVVPDGTSAFPGVWFKGQQGTGIYRLGTAIKFSLATTQYFHVGTDGIAWATGGGPFVGYALQMHGSGWLQTNADGNFLQLVLANNAVPTSATKLASFGLGTAASQALGGSGDLNLYTSGSAAGGVLLGTSALRRYGITNGGSHNWGTGALTGLSQFNFFQAANANTSGIRLHNTNAAIFNDFYSDAAGALGISTDGTTLFWLARTTGFLTLGTAANTSGRLTIIGTSAANTQGFCLIFGGGVGRGWIDTDGSFVMQSFTTIVRLAHATNAFVPGVDNVTALGSAALRWSTLAVGGFTMDAGAILPTADNTRILGNASFRFLTAHVIAMTNVTTTTAFMNIVQTSGVGTTVTPNVGLHLVYGGGETLMFQDSGGDLQVYGPGLTNTGFRMIFAQAALVPTTNGAMSLGTTAVRWSTLFLSGAATIAGAVNATAITPLANATSDLGTITLRWRHLNVEAVGIALGAVAPTALLQLGTDNAVKPLTNTWTIASDIRTKHADSIHEYTGGLAEILALRPVHYRTNGLGGTRAMAEDEPHAIGFVADEAAKVSPELVQKLRGKLRADDTRDVTLLGINTHPLPFMLINAFKEVDSVIEKLTARIDTLERQLAERTN